ncbi:MAG: hypothetical protein WC262_07065 [Bacteroidales bacterium]
MPLTNAGRNFMAAAICNDGPPTFYDDSNAYLGVGDSDTVFAADQTDLQAAVNKTRAGMDSGFPSVADNVISMQATFGSSDANHAWLEWGVFNASSAGTMLSREVENLGTKTTGTWVLEVDLTVEIGDEPA